MDRPAAIGARCLLAIGTLLAGFGVVHAAPSGSYTQLHTFTGGADGALSNSALTPDDFGNAYGASQGGGSYCETAAYNGCGTLYKLDGAGTLTTLHTFQGATDGGGPTTGLTLLGGVLFGGSGFGGQSDDGVLFSIRADGSDYKVFHSFRGVDGYQPAGLLQPGPGGGFFGISELGGKGFDSIHTGTGVLFFATPTGIFQVLHQFSYVKTGINPKELLIDKSGNLFGSAAGGQCSLSTTHGCGIVFEYAPNTNSFTILRVFDGTTDGSGPMLGAIGPDGTLYGATGGGGVNKRGTLFSMTPSNGTFKFSVLTSFSPGCRCRGPVNPPTLAANGSLVGGTDGFIYGYSSGRLEILHRFVDTAIVTGSLGQLLVSSNAVIYGTSEFGGVTPCPVTSGFPDPYGCGFIFNYSAGASD